MCLVTFSHPLHLPFGVVQGIRVECVQVVDLGLHFRERCRVVLNSVQGSQDEVEDQHIQHQSFRKLADHCGERPAHLSQDPVTVDHVVPELRPEAQRIDFTLEGLEGRKIERTGNLIQAHELRHLGFGVGLDFAVCALLLRRCLANSGCAVAPKVHTRGAKSVNGLEVNTLVCGQGLAKVLPPFWQELLDDDAEPGRPEETRRGLHHGT
mmetsp:Transcript_4496/g.13465  ORF Transcript_4496/g.13465 Transcript_4496/m.13465 type:complete len:209 (+) Transcript_4496:1228-1854(+)